MHVNTQASHMRNHKIYFITNTYKLHLMLVYMKLYSLHILVVVGISPSSNETANGFFASCMSGVHQRSPAFNQQTMVTGQ